MQPGGILALDLSSITGWCYGVADCEVPLFGTWHLPVEFGRGAVFASLENEVEDAIAEFRPAEVIQESPLDRAMKATARGTRNEQASRQQFGLAAAVEATCYRERVHCSDGHVNTVRKHVLGKGNIPADLVKGVVLHYCAMRGWHVPDHNSGDACVLWVYRASLVKLGRRVAA